MNKRFLCLAVAAAILLTAGPLLAATRVVTEPDRQVRPGAGINVWGASCTGGACTLGDGTSSGEAYTWVFAANANVLVTDDGNLSGVVGSDKYIAEAVSFTLMGGSTRELITATLTVGGQPSSNSVTFDIVDPTDPISATALDNLQIDTNIAISQAAEYLSQTQAADGCWYGTYGVNAKAASTGFTIWALENSGHLPTNDPNQDVYTDWIQAGLACLQTTAVPRGIFATWADVAREATAAQTSDVNSNGQSIQLTDAHVNYSHPIAAAAFISSLDTANYQTLVEDAIDFIGVAQNNALPGQGGWNYSGPSSRTDNSINSWNWMALEGGQTTAYGIDAPDWMLQESERVLIYQQTNPPDSAPGQPFGYSDFRPLQDFQPPYVQGHATTCAGLSGLAAVELENTVPVGSLINGQPAPLNSIATRRQAALDWLGAQWGQTVNSGSLGFSNRGNFYSMWTCCRALRLTEDALGLPTDTLTLVNGADSFNWSTGELNGTGVLSAHNTTTEGYSHWLVAEQQGNGSWAEGTYLGTLETPLGLLCLNQTVFGPPEPDCPEDPEPRTQGFWHRQCLGLSAAEGGIDPGRNGRGPQSPTVENFAPDLMDCAEAKLEDLGLYGITTCEGMDADPPSDKCEKALKQTTALILNQCWGQLEPGCEVDVSAEGCGSTDVGSLLTELAGLIMAGDNGSCQTAASCADAVNNGYGLSGGSLDAGLPQSLQETPAVRETGGAKGKPGSRR